MNRPGPSEPELLAIRRLAEELARSRKERATSAHLLAAVASRPSAAADLLYDRRLTVQGLLRAARSSGDEPAEAMAHALRRARDVAHRMGSQEVSSAHVIVALLSEPKNLARRALDQHGVDIARLRSQAMNFGLGLLGRRRLAGQVQATPVRVATAPSVSMKGTTMPLFPPSSGSQPARRGGALTSVRVAPNRRPAQAVRLHPEALPPSTDIKKRSTGASIRRARKVIPEARFQLDPGKFPALCAVGVNLTVAAARGELDRVVARDGEIEQTLDILAKRHGNNPCLVGPAGVGKTSVVYGLAQRIADGKDVVTLDDRIIVEIPLAELIAGTGVRGALAQRLSGILKEVKSARGRVVLFFDDLHQLFSNDVADEIVGDLKLALARGELPCIGATTPEAFKKTLEADGALSRRFTPVEVNELDREEAYLVLDGVATKLQAHHGVEYDERALAATIAWAIRYLPGRVLPDKAISIADLAGARARRRGSSEVDARAVAEVVAEAADIPLERLLETDGDRMLRLEHLLAERVVGHGPALCKVARMLRRDAAGLGARRPIGTFLLLGPTGVGKTETAKATAEVLFHSESAMTRLDLSEYAESHALARLIGAPPGYVGHDAGGYLTESVRRRPYQVLLLDEVEKAHPDVLMAFLGVFDEGRLTDGRGRTVDFTNTVIFMTSNLGAEQAASSTRRRVGFGSAEASTRGDSEQKLVSIARAALAPELYNRIDEVIVFLPLSRDQVREIARRQLARMSVLLEQRHGATLRVEDSCLDVLLEAGGYDPALGARPMRRAIARLVEAPLAERLLAGDVERGDIVVVRGHGGHVEVAVDTAVRGRTPAQKTQPCGSEACPAP